MPDPEQIAAVAKEAGIGVPYSPGCWHWFSDAWGDVIEHDGSAQMPETLDPREPVLIAYNPRDCQMAETWGAALRRAAPAEDRDWECGTAYRRLAVRNDLKDNQL